ncbi:hypothetical protein ACLOJK_012878 [Asimina triloba]
MAGALIVGGVRTAGFGGIGVLVGTLEAFLQLSFLSGNVVDNEFIELTNGVGRAKAELPCELMIPYALDESRHIYFCDEAWDLSSLLVESGHWFVRPLADVNELGGGDRSLLLVAEPGFKQVGELFKAGYEDEGERGEPHFPCLSRVVEKALHLSPLEAI